MNRTGNRIYHAPAWKMPIIEEFTRFKEGQSASLELFIKLFSDSYSGRLAGKLADYLKATPRERVPSVAVDCGDRRIHLPPRDSLFLMLALAHSLENGDTISIADIGSIDDDEKLSFRLPNAVTDIAFGSARLWTIDCWPIATLLSPTRSIFKPGDTLIALRNAAYRIVDGEVYTRATHRVDEQLHTDEQLHFIIDGMLYSPLFPEPADPDASKADVLKLRNTTALNFIAALHAAVLLATGKDIPPVSPAMGTLFSYLSSMLASYLDQNPPFGFQYSEFLVPLPCSVSGEVLGHNIEVLRARR